ncbi:CAP domain-containing protein [Methanolobus sp. WCC4]|uniref:CAP domain-containing protein n=1 Tax=Methanolobus sp. WCC4 TaxID=3125784 RepID=UPI0030F4C626
MSRTRKTIIVLTIIFSILVGIAGASGEYAAEEQEMLDLINEERAEHGLAPLKFNAVLNEAASEHSKEMIEKDYFSHDSYDGTAFSERLINAGYTIKYAGENIAMRYPPNLVAAHEDLMSSPGHRANILSPDYNEIGIGIWVGEYSGYSNVAMYTQDFGWNDAVSEPLELISSSPSDDTVVSGVEPITFSVTANYECDISWYFDEENLKTEIDVLSSYFEILPPASGTYQVKVVASGSEGDVSRTWAWTVNEESSGMKGDSNDDGMVDIIDLGAFARIYDTTTTGSGEWADFNDDGMIDILDLGAFARVYNK